MDIFEKHVTEWWNAQPDHHFMSKRSGCKAKNPSECPWPITHDPVAPDVILLDYDPDRVCYNEPVVRFASTFFPNQKNQTAQFKAATKARENKKGAVFMNETEDKANLWYFKTTGGGQMAINLKKLPNFIVDYQRCQILHVCHLAQALSETKIDPSSVYVVIMVLCGIIEKIAFEGKRQTEGGA